MIDSKRGKNPIRKPHFPYQEYSLERVEREHKPKIARDLSH